MTEHPATAEADHWSLGEIPPEPGPGTAVRDRNDAVWVRQESGWLCAGMIAFGGGTPWSRLLIERGPLVRLVPADAEREATVDRLIRVNDTLRAELARFRGAHAVRHAAETALRMYRSDAASTPRPLAGALDLLGDVLNKSDQTRHDSPDATAEATDLDAALVRRWSESL